MTTKPPRMPAAFTRAPLAPATEAACHPVHTKVCAMCNDFVEHHQGWDWVLCLAGRQRMAKARAGAGVELDAIDKLALATPLPEMPAEIIDGPSL